MKLRDLILHNFRLKVFSLLIAVLIWETIHLATRSRLIDTDSLLAPRTNQVER
jgi:hypothetical protein